MADKKRKNKLGRSDMMVEFGPLWRFIKSIEEAPERRDVSISDFLESTDRLFDLSKRSYLNYRELLWLSRQIIIISYIHEFGHLPYCFLKKQTTRKLKTNRKR